MGRNIPSVTCRIDAKARQWEKFARLLSAGEREAFRELMALARNRRTAIGEADEADIGVAILLAMVTHLKEESACLAEGMGPQRDGRQSSESRPGRSGDGRT